MVTITQVVQTQQNVNRLMERLSLVFLAVLLAVGGAAMVSTLYANVSERRKEIGTLMALGATPSLVLRLIVGKALVLGLAGGVRRLRCWAAARRCGWDRSWPTSPSGRCRGWRAWPCGIALAVTLLASLLPAWRAARLDPCVCFKEV